MKCDYDSAVVCFAFSSPEQKEYPDMHCGGCSPGFDCGEPGERICPCCHHEMIEVADPDVSPNPEDWSTHMECIHCGWVGTDHREAFGRGPTFPCPTCDGNTKVINDHCCRCSRALMDDLLEHETIEDQMVIEFEKRFRDDEIPF